MATIENPKTGSVNNKTFAAKASDKTNSKDFYPSSNYSRGSGERGTYIKKPNYNGERKYSYKSDNKNSKYPYNKEKSGTYYKEKSLEIENIINARLDANPELKSKLKFLVSVAKMMEAGVHIGLPASKWNSKMKPYIYDKKGKKYIIDLFQTLIGLNNAFDFLEQKSKAGKKFLFVGSKGALIKNTIKIQAKRSGDFFINQRWLGGTLTNFKTISESTRKLTELVIEKKFGKIEQYTKKEQVEKNKQIEKLNKFFGGIRTMAALPDAIIITNPIKEKNAVLEAKKLGIPIIAICNTDANPNDITFPIPANNYSIKVVSLMVTVLADAIAAGQNKPMEFVGKPDSEIEL